LESPLLPGSFKKVFLAQDHRALLNGGWLFLEKRVFGLTTRARVAKGGGKFQRKREALK
jgi:hypothetical protein